MKKTLLSIGLLSAMAFAANAQDAATSSSEVKAGNVTVELNASSPFSGGGAEPFSLSNNALRFRYFLSETTAIRLGFSIDRAGFNKTYGAKTENSSTAPGAQASGSEDNKVNLKSSTFQFSIMPGIEKHVLVSERLSAYYGGYVEFTLNSQKATAEVTPGSTTSAGVTTKTNDGSYKVEWKGASLEEPTEDVTLAGLQAGTGAGSVTKTTPGFTRLGLIGVIGADYYFTKGLYLGVEVSWGITGTTYKATETTTTNSLVAVGATGVTNTSKETDLAKSKSGTIAPAANAAFRFGFRF